MAYRFEQEGRAVAVLQSVSSGGVNGFHVIDPAHIEDRWHRLRTLWQAPLRQVNEELLLYVPDFEPPRRAAAAAALLGALDR
jgi:hypothetical protein